MQPSTVTAPPGISAQAASPGNEGGGLSQLWKAVTNSLSTAISSKAPAEEDCQKCPKCGVNVKDVRDIQCVQRFGCCAMCYFTGEPQTSSAEHAHLMVRILKYKRKVHLRQLLRRRPFRAQQVPLRQLLRWRPIRAQAIFLKRVPLLQLPRRQLIWALMWKRQSSKYRALSGRVDCLVQRRLHRRLRHLLRLNRSGTKMELLSKGKRRKRKMIRLTMAVAAAMMMMEMTAALRAAKAVAAVLLQDERRRKRKRRNANQSRW